MHRCPHGSLRVVNDEPGMHNFLVKALAPRAGHVQEAATAEQAAALRAGAGDFLLKPFRVAQELGAVANGPERAGLKRENWVLRRSLGQRTPPADALVGRSLVIKKSTCCRVPASRCGATSTPRAVQPSTARNCSRCG